MDSIKEFTNGLTEFVFVDDSNDPQIASKLSEWGEVIETHGEGYNAAMQAVVARAALEKDHVPFIEEDFTFIAPVDFHRLAAHLDNHPYLAQIVLQREPWFDAEKEFDSLVDFHTSKGKIFRDVEGFWEHTAFFSCNPGLWHRKTFEAGWPEGDWSEDAMKRKLVKSKKKFAFSKNVVVEHHGIRSGHGY